MDLSFGWLYEWFVLGLNRRRGHFCKFLGAPNDFYNAKSVFLAVSASFRCLLLAVKRLDQGHLHPTLELPGLENFYLWGELVQ